MGFTPLDISSLLVVLGAGLLSFSLVGELREHVRGGGEWRVWPVPPIEATAYAVLAFGFASAQPGWIELALAFAVFPTVLIAFRAVWVMGRRVERDPIRRGFEALERWMGGKE